MNATHGNIQVSELLDLRRSQMLIVNPEYQRGAVWTRPQKKKLVDSIFRGYPLPMIFLHHIKQTAGRLVSERYEIVDGQQRIAAIADFVDGAFDLFDPEKDAHEARFPDFIKRQPCPWAGRNFKDLSELHKKQLLDSMLPVAYITTENENEARDLFVRLQSGMPLNSQEKRDAWPGRFTDFVLRLGGKAGIARYDGHEFFNVLLKANKAKDRGKFRQLAAQISMLYFTKRHSRGRYLCDISSKDIDDFYYENLGFEDDNPDARRLVEILDKLCELFRDGKRSKLVGHEAIHLVLLVDSLWDEYTRSWESSLCGAFDRFRHDLSTAKSTKHSENPSDHWLRYGFYVHANTDHGENIRRRHEFFSSMIFSDIIPELKDKTRLFGPLEREIIYFRDRKQCAVCHAEVSWDEAEFHHVEQHARGGRTIVANGALVHRHCHPQGRAAIEFAEKWCDQRSTQPNRLFQ